MRLALLSDIHGNLQALDAVIADAQAMGVDGYWALGDLVAIGPEPVAVLERLAGLPNLRALRGNTDRYVVTGEGPPPSLEHARANPDLIDLYARVTASFAWTRGFVTAAGWFDWIERLPLEIRLTLPDGRRLLAVHASPGTDAGEGIHPARSNSELAALVEGCEAEIVCTGHTHEPMVRELRELREIDRVLAVNLGCVGNPLAPDFRASYLIVDATSAGTALHHRRVEYDRDAFADSVHRSRHPEGEFILSHQRGERTVRVPHPDHVVCRPSSPEVSVQ